ncbi:NAD(P)HX dehydratase [Lycorma delicatula]|uniref:NAD(P)HX dehydratase n=1 Tax=Lycorma delicatula TaxID=130591 RepID=UPI003F5175BA
MVRIFNRLSLNYKKNFFFVNHKNILNTDKRCVKMPELETNLLKDHCRSLLPELRADNHKGQCGRIGVFGGSLEFTGAPYYSGFSALRCGVDLVYIFCAAAAAQAIKSYSPELMVMPYLDSDNAIENISVWLDRFHAILIGPGLGRDPKVFGVLAKVIKVLNDYDPPVPIVFDADGLYFLTLYPDILKDYKNNVYITPNIVEFKRLTKAILQSDCQKPERDQLSELSQSLGKNVTVVLKGQVDLITQKDLTICCTTEGSPRRCGGQGDMLSGILTAFAAWVEIKRPKFDSTINITPELVASYCACHIVRSCNHLVFAEKGRGMLVTDMLEKILSVNNELFGE